MSKPIFVFGSNERGAHGKGAALYAYQKQGARYGVSYGHIGSSFAIPTMNQQIHPLSRNNIRMYVQGFLAYAWGHPELTFHVTRIGCGLAGWQDKDIAPMFDEAPLNCQFDKKWQPWLGDEYTYWIET
jgi:hypothetical protein